MSLSKLPTFAAPNFTSGLDSNRANGLDKCLLAAASRFRYLPGNAAACMPAGTWLPRGLLRGRRDKQCVTWVTLLPIAGCPVTLGSR
ncbi:hypothetical protein [Bremerella volcania]|uniref:hypothetical protein n=1 Tax=Bremerella volcania TaxID=2527984 RepID=UPI0011A2587B|nr:hypothetical protein [Bremerella volcania]